MLRRTAGIILAGMLLLLAACSQGAYVDSTPMRATTVADKVSTYPASPRPSLDTAMPTATETATLTTTPTTAPSAVPEIQVCSPLEDIPIIELSQPDLMKNAFDRPRPGIDDGHPGVDFSYWSRGERKAMIGLPVQSALPGTVAGIIQNRLPYGYAVIIETPLMVLTDDWIDRLQLPTPAPTVQPAPNLLCPPSLEDTTKSMERSLYLLYAHLNQPPNLAIDQTILCGQGIGEVGTTGRSVNPHLHLEVRMGPAGERFTEMAHYDNSATENEMRNYCNWRVSGSFYPLDPLVVIQALSLQP